MLKVKIVKLKRYKKEFVCYLDEVGDTQLIGADEVETIRELKKQGKYFYGTIDGKVFDEPFSDIKQMIDNKIEDYGYEEMGDNIYYDTDEFKAIVSAYKKWIASLGSINNIFKPDFNTIIEVE